MEKMSNNSKKVNMSKNGINSICWKNVDKKGKGIL